MGFHVPKPTEDEGLVWNRKDNKVKYDYVSLSFLLYMVCHFDRNAGR